MKIETAQYMSPAHREKLRIAKIGNTNHLGKKHSQESIKKMSLSHRGNTARLGKTHSLETRLKMSLARTGKMLGEKHHNWKGGTSKDVHSPSEPKYRKWREQVFERDDWTCQTCGVKGVYLEAHHIKSWAKYPEFRYVVENGLSLCLPCHRLTDNYRGKK